MAGKATYIRDMEGWRAHASLYRVDPPMKYYDYQGDSEIELTTPFVIASAVFAYSGEETLVFPAYETGEPINMLEIGGGRGYMDHAEALRDTGDGYEVSEVIDVEAAPTRLALEGGE